MGDEVLKGDDACRMSPAEAGRAIARKMGRSSAFSAQTVRNWIREGSGFPAEKDSGGRYVIRDIDAAAAWVSANKTDDGQGGSRENAGRKPAKVKARTRPLVDTSSGVGEFDDSADGDETTPAGNGFAGAAAETALSRARTAKVQHEAKITKLKLQQMQGQLIDRDEASAGFERVIGPLVRRLERVPGRAVDRAADRMNLTSEERAILGRVLTEEIIETRNEIAADPFGRKLDSEDAAA